jgi:bile acid-coenzyme A ligase
MTTDDASFGEVLGALAAADPEAAAITGGDVTVSRGEFHRSTNQLARAYQQLGVRPGSFVTIGLPNGIDFLESAFAVWKLGAIPQPVSHRLPPKELAAIVELIQPALVVGFGDDAGDGIAHVPPGFRPDAELPDDDLAPAVAPYWKAPTSGGSTGRPKVIVAVQPATYGSISGFAPVFGLSADGVTLTTGPLSHNGPFMSTVVSVLIGAHVVVMPRFDAATALELIEKHRVTWMYAVPTMMLRIWRLGEAERERHDLTSLQRVLHLAAPCPEWLKRAWIDWLGAEKIHELYAGTEAQAITIISGDEWLAHPGSVGRPVIGEIRVLDGNGNEVPPGTVGTLWMRRGEGEASPYKYLGAEPRAIDGGWECLGDIGRVDAEGYVYLTDREMDMILVGGANVYPAEIEAALEEHPAIRTSCVVGLPDEDMGQAVHAVVEAVEEVSDDALRSFLAERLAPYKLPRAIHHSTEPLRDEAGKVRRSAIRDSLVVVTSD